MNTLEMLRLDGGVGSVLLAVDATTFVLVPL